MAKICPFCSGANGALLAVNPLFRGKTAPKSRKRPDLPKTATWVPRGPGSGPFGQKNFSSRLSRATRKAVEAGIWQVKKVSSLRKLKDNNGAYIWQPSYQAGEPDRVLGYAVHTSAYAPEDAIAFGDYKYYNIGDRGTRSFSELRELFAGNGMIGYVAKERVDGKLILPEAVQILKLKASTPSGGGTE